MEKRCQVSMWTAGLNWYALPNLVVKADYSTRQIGTSKVSEPENTTAKTNSLSALLMSDGFQEIRNNLLINFYTMKKSFFYVAALMLGLAFTATSCSNDDDNEVSAADIDYNSEMQQAGTTI